jgi:hypothetical protein
VKDKLCGRETTHRFSGVRAYSSDRVAADVVRADNRVRGRRLPDRRERERDAGNGEECGEDGEAHGVLARVRGSLLRTGLLAL